MAKINVEQIEVINITDLPKTSNIDGLESLGVDKTDKAVQVPIEVLKGNKGEKGDVPYIGANGNWWIAGVDTGNNARPSIVSEKGDREDAAISQKAFTGEIENKADKTDTIGNKVVYAPDGVISIPDNIPTLSEIKGGIIDITEELRSYIKNGYGYNSNKACYYNSTLVGKTYMIAYYPLLKGDCLIKGIDTSSAILGYDNIQLYKDNKEGSSLPYKSIYQGSKGGDIIFSVSEDSFLCCYIKLAQGGEKDFDSTTTVTATYESALGDSFILKTKDHTVQVGGNQNSSLPTIDIFSPKKIYTVCNNIASDTDIARIYGAAIYLDHLIELDTYTPLHFDRTKNDKVSLLSKIVTTGANNSKTISLVDKKEIINGAKNASISFSHISTLNTATKDKFPIVLCIGDSVTEWYGSHRNIPYENSPTAYWSWAKAFFRLDQKEANNENLYKSLFVGQRNLIECIIKYNEEEVAVRACAEGRGGAKLSDYLRSNAIGGDTNHFYDSSKTTTNKFSILYWLKKFRTMDNSGNRLVGNAGTTVTGGDGNSYTIGTSASNTSAYDVCTPTHVVIQLGYNDLNHGATTAAYINDITAMIQIIRTELPDCMIAISLPDAPGTYFPEFNQEFFMDTEAYNPISIFVGEAKRFHKLFRDANKELIKLEDISNKVYYLPSFFVSPTADSAAHRVDRLSSYLSNGDSKDFQKTVISNGPFLHPNNIAHNTWGYQLYSWVKYTMVL